MRFRDLRADEIECRVQSVKKNGLILLLYKNARCDMNILDETVGAENWQRDHYECKGNLFCRVGINTNYANTELPDRWVWKSDCGVESNTEAQKGEASDSFKRACFNWGIGRELYTAPFTWIPDKKCNIEEKQDARGKTIYVCYDKFEVESIKIENKKITDLSIINTSTNERCFGMYSKPSAVVPKNTPSDIEGAVPFALSPRQQLFMKCKEKGIDATEYAQKHGIDKSTPDDVILECITDLG
jgi:hypothetical protein